MSETTETLNLVYELGVKAGNLLSERNNLVEEVARLDMLVKNLQTENASLRKKCEKARE